MRQKKKRAAFTDGDAPAPATMAVDARPEAGDQGVYGILAKNFLLKDYAKCDREKYTDPRAKTEED
jgi:hypothetical protein